MTRAEAEFELVSRAKGIMAKGGMSLVTDGTNADLNGPMRRALVEIGVPAAGQTVTDADIAKIPVGKLEDFYLKAEFYTVDTVASNAVATSATSRLGPRQESNKDWLTGLSNRWKYLKGKANPDDPSGGGSGGGAINNNIRSHGTAHIWGVWHPQSARDLRRSDAGTRTGGKQDPDPPPSAVPYQPRPVVIDVGKDQHPFRIAYDQYAVINTTEQPIGVILPPIGVGDDGKTVRAQLAVQGQSADGLTKYVGIVTTQGGSTLIGVADSRYLLNDSTMQIAHPGEAVEFIADEDNNQWLVHYFEAPDNVDATQPPVTLRGAGILAVDVDLPPNGVERIPHKLNTRDVEVQAYWREGDRAGSTVTLDVQREQTAVTVRSVPGGKYRVVIVGGEGAGDGTGDDKTQRVKIHNCDTVPNVPCRVEHNWGTRDVDVAVFDRITGNPATVHVVREQNAVVITSSVARKYRVVIEEQIS